MHYNCKQLGGSGPYRETLAHSLNEGIKRSIPLWAFVVPGDKHDESEAFIVLDSDLSSKGFRTFCYLSVMLF